MTDLRCLSAASALVVHHCVFTQTDIVHTPSTKEPWRWSYCAGGAWGRRGGERKGEDTARRGDVCRVSVSINQSINQSVNQSINRSINQSISQSTNQLINRSINQSINQSTNQPINQPIIKGHMTYCGSSLTMILSGPFLFSAVMSDSKHHHHDRSYRNQYQHKHGHNEPGRLVEWNTLVVCKGAWGGRGGRR